MQYLSVALPLAAMVSGVFANPAWGGNGACANNACLAAVTGKAALGDGSIRASHCSSYLATTVTPIFTVTETVTGSGGKDGWKRATVALCPNEVPNYASACDDAAYTSACSCFGFTEIKTTTIATSTSTKTVYVKPTGGAGSSCTASTVKVTATVVSGSTCPAAATSTTTKVIVTGTTVTESKTGTITVVTGSTCPAGSTVTETKVVPTWSSSCSAAGTVTVVTGSTCPAGSTVTETKVVPTWSSSCPASGTVTGTTVTVTVATASALTITATATTVTVTQSGTCSTSSAPASSTCNVDAALATTLVNNFVDLLQYTSYAGNPALGVPAGRGYHQDVSDATLAADGFTDLSDSINFMAGFPLGSVTFASKGAFDYGQGVLQPEVTVKVLNIWVNCNTVTWRWRIVSLPYPVNGINHMEINADGKIQKNYAEFDNGAWLQSFGRNCTTNTPVQVSSTVALKRSLLEM